MSSEDRDHQLHNEICELLLQAGWLHRFTFTTGKGFHLVWTEFGGERSKLLRQIVGVYRLRDTDDAPRLFNERSRSPSFLSAASFAEHGAAVAWTQAVDSIQLPQDEDHLLAFAHLFAVWGLERDD